MDDGPPPGCAGRGGEAKAACEHGTFTPIVEEGLQSVVAADFEDAPLDPLPEFGEAGGTFLVDVDAKDALWAVLVTDDIGDAPGPATRQSPKHAPR